MAALSRRREWWSGRLEENVPIYPILRRVLVSDGFIVVTRVNVEGENERNTTFGSEAGPKVPHRVGRVTARTVMCDSFELLPPTTSRAMCAMPHCACEPFNASPTHSLARKIRVIPRVARPNAGDILGRLFRIYAFKYS